jgi:hypothetical protein
VCASSSTQTILLTYADEWRLKPIKCLRADYDGAGKTGSRGVVPIPQCPFAGRNRSRHQKPKVKTNTLSCSIL